MKRPEEYRERDGKFGATFVAGGGYAVSWMKVVFEPDHEIARTTDKASAERIADALNLQRQ